MDPSGTLDEIINSGILEKRVLSSVVDYFNTLEGTLNATDLEMWYGQTRFDTSAASLSDNLNLFLQSMQVDSTFIR